MGIHQLFLQADRDGNGCLDWNNGEIRNFIRSAYEFHGLPDPSPLDDGHAFQLFQRFDADRSGSLDVRECLALVDVSGDSPCLWKLECLSESPQRWTCSYSQSAWTKRESVCCQGQSASVLQQVSGMEDGRGGRCAH